MLIGRIRGAHGVHGELAVDPETDFPERFRRLTHVYLGDSHRRAAVSSARVGGRIFLTLAGVTNREQAQALHGTELSIPREEAMPLADGQFYADEIIGLRVETESGQDLGEIAGIIDTGSNDVYVVRGNGRELLIPAIQDVVLSLDPAGGRVVIRVVEGLLD